MRLTNAEFEGQALYALRMARGAWHCPPCWGAVAGLSSSRDAARLVEVAQVIRMSQKYERATTDQEPAPVCTRAGVVGCDFEADGRRSQGPDAETWVVRAKPLSDLR